MPTQMSKSQLIEKISTVTELSKRDVNSVPFGSADAIAFQRICFSPERMHVAGRGPLCARLVLGFAAAGGRINVCTASQTVST